MKNFIVVVMIVQRMATAHDDPVRPVSVLLKRIDFTWHGSWSHSAILVFLVSIRNMHFPSDFCSVEPLH